MLAVLKLAVLNLVNLLLSCVGLQDREHEAPHDNVDPGEREHIRSAQMRFGRRLGPANPVALEQLSARIHGGGGHRLQHLEGYWENSAVLLQGQLDLVERWEWEGGAAELVHLRWDGELAIYRALIAGDLDLWDIVDALGIDVGELRDEDLLGGVEDPLGEEEDLLGETREEGDLDLDEYDDSGFEPGEDHLYEPEDDDGLPDLSADDHDLSDLPADNDRPDLSADDDDLPDLPADDDDLPYLSAADDLPDLPADDDDLSDLPADDDDLSDLPADYDDLPDLPADDDDLPDLPADDDDLSDLPADDHDFPDLPADDLPDLPADHDLPDLPADPVPIEFRFLLP